MTKSPDEIPADIKKLAAAFIATDPMLSRLIQAGEYSQCAEMVQRKFTTMLAYLSSDPPGYWAIIRPENGRSAVFVYERLDYALEDLDVENDILCPAKFDDGQLWLAWDGRYRPFNGVRADDYSDENHHD